MKGVEKRTGGGCNGGSRGGVRGLTPLQSCFLFACQFENSCGPAFSSTQNPPPPSRIPGCTPGGVYIKGG